ncbi:MAG: efflux RND transporter permease subunit [Phycisphaerales bacterium]|nr:efflux RND transporter permease subunit [Phycisphaerales bacterium]MCB9864578.1 efflux RND transporter permease subunit [Phycisphaerales bacterium]
MVDSSDPLGLQAHHGFTNAVVRSFLNSNMSLVLILLAAAVGLVSLYVTPREEDPQIVVPLADVYVNFPGHTAQEVEQLVATPLEKLLFEIDGVEYVYSMSREGQAIITVRFFVGEDRERSLVKLYKRIDEHIDVVPPGVTGWVIKPVEIDDVPIVTLTLTGADSDGYILRRVSEEVVQRLSSIEDLSRAYVVGGQSRVVHVYLDSAGMQSRGVAPLDVGRALEATNVSRIVGDYDQIDADIRVEVGDAFSHPGELSELVVAVVGDNPVFLKDVAAIVDGPAEVDQYVRHGWGCASGFEDRPGFPGGVLGRDEPTKSSQEVPTPAVTIALAKKKGTNAVRVADEIIAAADALRTTIVPDDIDIVITRNYGLSADEKVNELVEALAVAIFIVIALLTLGLGKREALIVALAVPVVFGLTLTVNLLLGFSINRVTLFALILSLGLLVDDPIVDVENISRHFLLHRRATREIVMEAVAEIRPPLITATLAVIVSFVPLFFITGMMGPYMRPMALNVPVAMMMSMVVAFTITPWLSYHLLRKKYTSTSGADAAPSDPHDTSGVKQTPLYRFFYPLMAPLLHSRFNAWIFLIVTGGLTLLAAGLALTRHVPLKMLPFDNKNELLLVLDMNEGTTLERTDACVRDIENYLANVLEVTDFVSYVGLNSPMDFNGMVRHYYLRKGPQYAEIRVNLVGKKSRSQQSHAIGLRMRDDLTRIARKHESNLKIVEVPPGPPVLATLVAEIYGRPDHTYDDLQDAARIVRRRLEQEPCVVDVDDTIESVQTKIVFVADREKAAINGVAVADIAATLDTALAGMSAGIIHDPDERNPLAILVRLPRADRSSEIDLAQIRVHGSGGMLVPLAELGHWEERRVDQTIYHKNLRRVAYVFGDTAGRAPAEAVVDMLADRIDAPNSNSSDRHAIANSKPRPLSGRTYLTPGSDLPWSVPSGIDVDFAGEGEWKITLDVFRDLGLAFAAALVGIYVLLVAQMKSFVVPVVVMLAIPLNLLGIMPGFWLLNAVGANQIGGYSDPIFFTATGMIGMIALAGIVTRDAIILIDFIHLSQSRGRSLFDAIMESRVVRLRPILLTAGTALLSAAPITIDPVFSGLAWSLIFGLLASTLFTLFVIPIAYWLIYERTRPTTGHA